MTVRDACPASNPEAFPKMRPTLNDSRPTTGDASITTAGKFTVHAINFGEDRKKYLAKTGERPKSIEETSAKLWALPLTFREPSP